LAEEKNGPIKRPVHGLVPRRVKEGVGHVGKGRALLRHEWRAEERIGYAVADAKRRLRTELFEHELLNRVVEQSPTHTDGGLIRAARKFGERSVLPARTPVQTKARSKRFVIGAEETAGDTFVSGNDESSRGRPGICAVRCYPRTVELGKRTKARVAGSGVSRREITRKDCRALTGIEALHFLADVGEGRVHFPAQAVVQRDVGFEFPAVLGKQVQGGAADELRIGGSLRVRNRQSKQIVCKRIDGSSVVVAARTRYIRR